MIRDFGHQVVSAHDVAEALLILQSPCPIDAIFTDIHLKDALFGGCEVAQAAILLRPELRVLYTTGSSVSDEMKAMFVAGSDCLRKPYQDHQLARGVEQLLAA